MDLDAFFEGYPEARRLFDELRARVDGLGPTELRVGRSQVAFVRRRAFGWAWIPARWLRGDTAPLVLSVALRRRDPSPRWKEVVEPRPGRFTHHLELRREADLDDEVAGRLREAWEQAA